MNEHAEPGRKLDHLEMDALHQEVRSFCLNVMGTQVNTEDTRKLAEGIVSHVKRVQSDLAAMTTQLIREAPELEQSIKMNAAKLNMCLVLASEHLTRQLEAYGRITK